MSDRQPSVPFAYKGLRCISNAIASVLFEKIETTGQHSIPTHDACVFIVTPHAPQLHNVILLCSKNPRHSHGVMASLPRKRSYTPLNPTASSADRLPDYKDIQNHFARQGCVTVFTEDDGHGQPEGMPLHDLSAMVLGAMAVYPSLNINIVPVGVSYFGVDRFRPKALVSFGQSLNVNRSEIKGFKAGGTARQEAVTRFTNRYNEALRSLVAHEPDDQTEETLRVAHQLYQLSDKRSLTLSQVAELHRHFETAWTSLQDHPRRQALCRKIKLYNETLAFFGLHSQQVGALDTTPTRAVFLLIRHLLTLGCLTGLGAPVFLSNLPLVWLSKYIHLGKDTTAGLVAKMTGNVFTTRRVLSALFAAPVLYGFYALLYLEYLVRKRSELSHRTKLVRTGIAWAIQPMMGYALLRLGDVGLDIFRTIKPLFLAIRNPEASNIIQIMRKDLAKDIAAFVEDHRALFFPY